MDVIAFVLSCFALPISVVSLVFVWRRDQRDKARRTDEEKRHAWEQERRHRDRTPKLHGGIEPMNEGAWHRLWVELDSGESLTSLRVELPDDAGLQFTPSQNGVGSDAVLAVADWNDLATTGRAVWRIEQIVERKRTVRVVGRCRIGDDEWPVPVDIQTPSAPARFYML